MYKEIIVYKDCGFELRINGNIVYFKFIKDKNAMTRTHRVLALHVDHICNILLSSNLNAPLFNIKIDMLQQSNTTGLREYCITFNYQDKNLINKGYGNHPDILLGPQYFRVKSVTCPELKAGEGILFTLGDRLNHNSTKCVIQHVATQEKLFRTVKRLNETPAIEIIFNHLQYYSFG